MAAAVAPKGKVLVIMSGADHIRLQSGRQQETGFFLKELGRPLIKLLEAGYDVEFANPTGSPPHMDPFSDMSVWFAGLGAELEREKQLLEKMAAEKNFNRPRKFMEYSDQDLDKFVGVLLPGGHAPMVDLWSDPDLGRILLHFHNAQKPTGSICHAPIALLATKQLQPDKPWAYIGYHMTCYSDREEMANEMMWWDKLPFKVESELKKNGAILEEAAVPMMPKVTIDRELISAQGPTSADQFGTAFVNALQSDRATVVN